jgi:hypothetical protein
MHNQHKHMRKHRHNHHRRTKSFGRMTLMVVVAGLSIW